MNFCPITTHNYRNWITHNMCGSVFKIIFSPLASHTHSVRENLCGRHIYVSLTIIFIHRENQVAWLNIFFRQLVAIAPAQSLLTEVNTKYNCAHDYFVLYQQLANHCFYCSPNIYKHISYELWYRMNEGRAGLRKYKKKE